MITATSRYAIATETEFTRPDGSKVRHIVPPILPHPEDHTVARQHRVTDSDRADIIAAQTYGQATAWWMIANANSAAHPDQLTAVPGAPLVIPMPDARGGRTT
ncbi:MULTISPECIES: hypothetical protein [Ensifer]|jgi:nucleoid-associated protein YgaU|uniref:hypothetical protein n=1 Tax=Ensifer TaxID=106591 RepID=UPI000713043D|nr:MULTISPECIES: hypothetical protein [Ensifer]KQX25812.1 hypothetical protein ASD01_25265 [Ensifer sp. Root423]KQX54805.1 hypothetical protein ASD49_27965 [Ensifer sp. Root1298]KQX89179.1 hypothetical protein ASD41_26645 [Ensifer sp. Root1312]KRC24990.1 hypothetical protein ASE29_25465 [Ensifer sp. Root74]KRD78300.1 hypothetical protein ASE71_15460 [Ensifer sp. Root954]